MAGHLDPGEPGRHGVRPDEVGTPARHRLLFHDERGDDQADHDKDCHLDRRPRDESIADDPEGVREARIALRAAGDHRQARGSLRILAQQPLHEVQQTCTGLG